MEKSMMSLRTFGAGWSLAGYLLTGVALGLLLMALPPLAVLALLAATAFCALLAKKPEVGVLTIVVLVASIVKEDDLLLLPIGIGSLNITDVVLLFMFLLVAAKRLGNQDVKSAHSPLETPLMLFLLMTLLSAGIAVSVAGQEFYIVARVFRTTSYYFIFYVITNLITTRKQLTFLVKGLFAIAVVVALAMLIQTILGDSVSLIGEKEIELAGGLDNEYDALRLRPPGQTLVFASFIVAVSFLVLNRYRSLLFSGYFYLAAILGIGVALTFTRSYLVAIVISCALLFLFARAEGKKRMAALGGCCAIMVALLLALPLGGKIGSTADAVSQRYLTLLAGKELVVSNSLNDRYLENGYALRQIQEHPLLGIGLGSEYRPQIYGSQDELTNYVHNGYLWLLTDMGIPGLLFFMWFFLRFLERGIRNRRKIRDPYLESMATGSLLVGIVILPMALVVPLFMEWHSIVVVAILAGISEVIILNPKLQTTPQEARATGGPATRA